MDRRTFLASGMLALVAAPALAQPGLTSADAERVDRAREYLRGLTSVQGRFSQVDHRGRRSAGAFFYKAPGRVRFVYDPPSGMVVTTDGDNVLIADARLGSHDRFPLNSTPIGLFIGRAVAFGRGVNVTRVASRGDGFTVAVSGRRASEGRAVLSFADEPLRLLGWTAIDPNGRSTQVSLTGLRATPLSDGLFSTTPPASARARR